MIVDVDYAHLHSGIFLNDTNLQDKLYAEGKRINNRGGITHGRPGLTMQFDEEKKTLLVHFNGVTGNVPDGNICVYVKSKNIITAPVVTEKQVQATIAQDQKASVVAAQETVSRIGKLKQPSAQVSGPASHVFADAPGKVRD